MGDAGGAAGATLAAARRLAELPQLRATASRASVSAAALAADLGRGAGPQLRRKEDGTSPPPPKGAIVRQSKPLPYLAEAAEGRTDFFAELAQTVGMEIQRLLRYTLLGYTSNLSAELEQKAEADVHSSLRAILDRLGAYVDSAVQAVQESASAKPMEPGVEASVLSAQLDESIAHAQKLSGDVAAQEEKARKYLCMMKTMRVQYYNDLERQRDAIRSLMLKHVPDMPVGEMEGFLIDLSKVRFFEPSNFYDEDTTQVVRQKAAEMEANFSVEREQLMVRNKALTASEVNLKRQLDQAQEQVQKLQLRLERTSSPRGGIIGSPANGQANSLNPSSAGESPPGTSSKRLLARADTGRDDLRDMVKQVQEAKRNEEKLMLEVGALNDLVNQQWSWVEELGKSKEADMFRLMTGNLSTKIGQIQEAFVLSPCETDWEEEYRNEKLRADKLQNEADVLRSVEEMRKARIVELEVKSENLQNSLADKEVELSIAEDDLQNLRKMQPAGAVVRALTRKKKNADKKKEDAEVSPGPSPRRAKKAPDDFFSQGSEELKDVAAGKGQEEFRKINKLMREKRTLEKENNQLRAKLAMEQQAHYHSEGSKGAPSRVGSPPPATASQDAPQDSHGEGSRADHDAGEETEAEEEGESEIDGERESESDAEAHREEEGGEASHRGEGPRRRTRTSDRPKTGDSRPKTGDSRPRTGDSRPRTGDSRPRTGDSRPRTGERPRTSERTHTGERHEESKTGEAPRTSTVGGSRVSQEEPKKRAVYLVDRMAQTEAEQGRPEMVSQEVQTAAAKPRRWPKGNSETDRLLAASDGFSAEGDVQHRVMSAESADGEALPGELELEDSGGEMLRASKPSTRGTVRTLHGALDGSRASSAEPTEGEGLCEEDPKAKSSLQTARTFEGSGSDGEAYDHAEAVHEADLILEAADSTMDKARGLVDLLKSVKERAFEAKCRADDEYQRASLAPTEYDQQRWKQVRREFIEAQADLAKLELELDALDTGSDESLYNSQEARSLARVSAAQKLMARAVAGYNEGRRPELVQTQSVHRWALARAATSAKLATTAEMKVAYEARLHTELEDARARLYRAWPRVASEEPPRRRSFSERFGSRKALDQEVELVRDQVVEERNLALRHIDRARLLAYSHAAKQRGVADDPRQGDLKEVLQSKELFSYLECLGTMSRRVLACKSDFERLTERLRVAFFDADRLRVELGMLKEEYVQQSGDAAELFRRQAQCLAKCKKVIERAGLRVKIPKALLSPSLKSETLKNFLQEEIGDGGSSDPEAVERKVEAHLDRCRAEARPEQLGSTRQMTLQHQRVAYRMASALSDFHVLHEEGGNVQDLKQLAKAADESTDKSDKSSRATKLSALLREGAIANMAAKAFQQAGRREMAGHEIAGRLKERELAAQTILAHSRDEPKLGGKFLNRRMSEMTDTARHAINYFDQVDQLWGPASAEEASTDAPPAANGELPPSSSSSSSEDDGLATESSLPPSGFQSRRRSSGLPTFRHIFDLAKSRKASLERKVVSEEAGRAAKEAAEAMAQLQTELEQASEDEATAQGAEARPAFEAGERRRPSTGGAAAAPMPPAALSRYASAPAGGNAPPAAAAATAAADPAAAEAGEAEAGAGVGTEASAAEAGAAAAEVGSQEEGGDGSGQAGGASDGRTPGSSGGGAAGEDAGSPAEASEQPPGSAGSRRASELGPAAPPAEGSPQAEGSGAPATAADASASDVGQGPPAAGGTGPEAAGPEATAGEGAGGGGPAAPAAGPSLNSLEPPIIDVRRDGALVELSFTVPHSLWEAGDLLAEDPRKVVDNLVHTVEPVAQLVAPEWIQEFEKLADEELAMVANAAPSSSRRPVSQVTMTESLGQAIMNEPPRKLTEDDVGGTGAQKVDSSSSCSDASSMPASPKFNRAHALAWMRRTKGRSGEAQAALAKRPLACCPNCGTSLAARGEDLEAAGGFPSGTSAEQALQQPSSVYLASEGNESLGDRPIDIARSRVLMRSNSRNNRENLKVRGHSLVSSSGLFGQLLEEGSGKIPLQHSRQNSKQALRSRGDSGSFSNARQPSRQSSKQRSADHGAAVAAALRSRGAESRSSFGSSAGSGTPRSRSEEPPASRPPGSEAEREEGQARRKRAARSLEGGRGLKRASSQWDLGQEGCAEEADGLAEDAPSDCWDEQDAAAQHSRGGLLHDQRGMHMQRRFSAESLDAPSVASTPSTSSRHFRGSAGLPAIVARRFGSQRSQVIHRGGGGGVSRSKVGKATQTEHPHPCRPAAVQTDGGPSIQGKVVGTQTEMHLVVRMEHTRRLAMKVKANAAGAGPVGPDDEGREERRHAGIVAEAATLASGAAALALNIIGAGNTQEPLEPPEGGEAGGAPAQACERRPTLMRRLSVNMQTMAGSSVRRRSRRRAKGLKRLLRHQSTASLGHEEDHPDDELSNTPEQEVEADAAEKAEEGAPEAGAPSSPGSPKASRDPGSPRRAPPQAGAGAGTESSKGDAPPASASPSSLGSDDEQPTATEAGELWDDSSVEDAAAIEVVDVAQQSDLAWEKLPEKIVQWLKLNLLQREQSELYCIPWETSELEDFPRLPKQKRDRLVRDFEDFLDEVLCRSHPTKHELRRGLRDRYRGTSPPRQAAAQQELPAEPEGEPGMQDSARQPQPGPYEYPVVVVPASAPVPGRNTPPPASRAGEVRRGRVEIAPIVPCGPGELAPGSGGLTRQQLRIFAVKTAEVEKISVSERLGIELPKSVFKAAEQDPYCLAAAEKHGLELPEGSRPPGVERELLPAAGEAEERKEPVQPAKEEEPSMRERLERLAAVLGLVERAQVRHLRAVLERLSPTTGLMKILSPRVPKRGAEQRRPPRRRALLPAPDPSVPSQSLSPGRDVSPGNTHNSYVGCVGWNYSRTPRSAAAAPWLRAAGVEEPPPTAPARAAGAGQRRPETTPGRSAAWLPSSGRPPGSELSLPHISSPRQPREAKTTPRFPRAEEFLMQA